jgi:hypothetical protein
MHHRSPSSWLVVSAIFLLGLAPLVAPMAGAQTDEKVLRVNQGAFPQLDQYPLDPQKTCC